jgi:phosphosulfolactate synthase
MVLDRCQGLRATEDLLELTGDYIDQIKLSFGTSVFLADGLLRRKIEIIRSRDIDVYPGGTLFEAAVVQGVLPEYLARAQALCFTAVEISDGTIDLDPRTRADAIRRARDRGLKVFTEVGKKDPNAQPSPEALGERIMLDLHLGAEAVVVEGRESGMRVGVYDERGQVVEDRVNRILAGLDDTSRVMWETPLGHQQNYFVLRFGANANLGNIRPNDVLALEALRCGLRWETLRTYLPAPDEDEAVPVGARDLLLSAVDD